MSLTLDIQMKNGLFKVFFIRKKSRIVKPQTSLIVIAADAFLGGNRLLVSKTLPNDLANFSLCSSIIRSRGQLVLFTQVSPNQKKQFPLNEGIAFFNMSIFGQSV